MDSISLVGVACTCITDTCIPETFLRKYSRECSQERFQNHSQERFQQCHDLARNISTLLNIVQFAQNFDD